MDQGKAVKAAILVSGVVQGVGFRPFIARLAEKCGITGFVRNACGHVLIEAFGTKDSVKTFVTDIPKNKPPASQIGNIKWDIHPVTEEENLPSSFFIEPSSGDSKGMVMPSPDIAVCEDCLRELYSPQDPRYRNPFISCTNCGPRFSILRSIPYDRIRTTMDVYPMCKLCKEEYGAAQNRRFHAQTVCCNECGPVISYIGRNERLLGQNAVDAAVQALLKQKILAIKGIGGYHFACNPFDDSAVAALRAIKGREQKPFAVMFEDIGQVRAYCAMNVEEESLLTSPARPIVLIKRISDFLSENVSANSPYLGAFLPYTPLQQLILKATGPLVMTSANHTSLPIIKDDGEMTLFFSEHKALGGVLTHDREILRRLDDSVVMVSAGHARFIRRARGYVPLPIAVPLGETALLACGSQEKCVFSLYTSGLVYPSTEIGDLDNTQTLQVYSESVADMQDTMRVAPALAVCDMHPGYESSKYAQQTGLPVRKVQHHHAHIASVMAEHGLKNRIIGVAFDGTGYGTDGTIWGGEFLIVSPTGFTRAAHLKPVKLLGSDSSVNQGWKSAICMQHDAGIPAGDSRAELVCAALDNDINTILSSSMGRVFDAVSAMLGICAISEYDGQCAIALEYAAMRHKAADHTEALPYALFDKDGVISIDLAPSIRELHRCRENGDDAAALAYRFHHTISRMIAAVCARLRETHGIEEIALSGGVFFNRILLEETIPLLQQAGFTVYTNKQVPAGDGGLSLGQAYAALLAQV